MLIYSETSKIFIERVRSEIRTLFQNEISPIFPLNYNRSRVAYKNFQFPLSVVVFEDNSRLGYFDFRYYEIGISKKLIFSAFDEIILNVIRHELAHYIEYLLYSGDHGHGEYFKFICQKLNWGNEISSAYSNVDIENLKITNPNQKNAELLNKIKKLFALASSENIHESEMATLKANQLLLNYNLSLADVNLNKHDLEIIVKRVLESPKKNAKHLAIYDILKTFYVSPVFNHGKKNVYLEIVGSFENVEIAEYVANFLDHEFDRLWKKSKKDNPHLMGTKAKNSFFRGIAQGFLLKINAARNIEQNKNALILIQKSLDQNLDFVYSRLGSSSRSQTFNDKNAMNAGIAAGKNLSINPAIKNKNSTTLLL
jgi:hypothetical protein